MKVCGWKSLVFITALMIILATPQKEPPPCAFLKASLFFHACGAHQEGDASARVRSARRFRNQLRLAAG